MFNIELFWHLTVCNQNLYLWCIVIYMFMQHHNDTTIKTDARRKTHEERKQEDFFRKIFTSHFIARFERVVQGLHVRGCWRSNINFIFLTPLLWLSRWVFLVLLMLGFPTTSGLYVSGILLATALAPNSTELNNNSTPTRSPTGSLKSNV